MCCNKKVPHKIVWHGFQTSLLALDISMSNQSRTEINNWLPRSAKPILKKKTVTRFRLLNPAVIGSIIETILTYPPETWTMNPPPRYPRRSNKILSKEFKMYQRITRILIRTNDFSISAVQNYKQLTLSSLMSKIRSRRLLGQSAGRLLSTRMMAWRKLVRSEGPFNF